MLGARLRMEGTDPFLSPSALQTAPGIPTEYLEMKEITLYKFVVSTSSGKEPPIAEKNRTFRDPDFNYTLDELYPCDCDNGMVCSSFMKDLLLE